MNKKIKEFIEIWALVAEEVNVKNLVFYEPNCDKPWGVLKCDPYWHRIKPKLFRVVK